jgi:hypothetical protein
VKFVALKKVIQLIIVSLLFLVVGLEIRDGKNRIMDRDKHYGPATLLSAQ